MRRLQNLKKYPTFFWSQNSRNDFFKFLWPSQNIWPLTRPETPWLNLLIACSQNLIDFFTNTVTQATYMIIFSPHNKSWHRKAPDAPLWNESWFFMFSGSEDHQTSFRLCSFIFLFWYSRSITWSWVTYVPVYTNHFKLFFEEAFSIFLSDSIAPLLKFLFSKKATKIFTIDLTHYVWLHNVKSTVKIPSIFVALLENMNFKDNLLYQIWVITLSAKKSHNLLPYFPI